jgi:hypothetical protein
MIGSIFERWRCGSDWQSYKGFSKSALTLQLRSLPLHTHLLLGAGNLRVSISLHKQISFKTQINFIMVHSSSTLVLASVFALGVSSVLAAPTCVPLLTLCVIHLTKLFIISVARLHHLSMPPLPCLSRTPPLLLTQGLRGLYQIFWQAHGRPLGMFISAKFTSIQSDCLVVNCCLLVPHPRPLRRPRPLRPLRRPQRPQRLPRVLKSPPQESFRRPGSPMRKFRIYHIDYN